MESSLHNSSPDSTRSTDYDGGSTQTTAIATDLTRDYTDNEAAPEHTQKNKNSLQGVNADRVVNKEDRVSEQETSNQVIPESNNKNKVQTEAPETVDELVSDGSASAFEGTEAIDSHDEDPETKRKQQQLENDPSGRSYY